MAGKTKKHAAAVAPSRSGSGMSGHLGLKSSPYCVTDAKLTSQMIVRDRMNAHYKNLTHAKTAIDTSPPKSMLISTKKRDQARREAMKNGSTPRSARKQGHQSRPGSRASDFDRQDLLEAYASYDNDDYNAYQRNGTGSLDAQPPSDLTGEYGKMNGTYGRPISARLGKTYNGGTLKPGMSPRSTPRSGDILDSRSHVFTETQKQFQPRILKTNQTSRLSQLKLYNPPIKKSVRSPSPDVKQTTLRSAMTSQTLNSTELMNESLMSRDNNQPKTPTGIPPLDISLDKDHLKWLREQSMKTPSRSLKSQRADPAMSRQISRLNSTNGQPRTLSTGRVPLSPTLVKVSQEEEELKYLDFIRDVTNDVLDRGIFTDRVLKKVFNAHIEKRRHELDVDRMKEMVADLREDLNIPEHDEEPEENLGKTRTYLGKLQSADAGQRPPLPKTKGHTQSSYSFVDTKTNKDINENIVDSYDTYKSNDFDMSKRSDHFDGMNGADTYNKAFNNHDNNPITLDDLAEPTERTVRGPSDDTFRDIAPAVSSAVRNTFGDDSGLSTPKEESPSRKPSLSSTRNESVSNHGSVTSMRESNLSRQASLSSAKENSISRQTSVASVKPGISRQSSVGSAKSDNVGSVRSKNSPSPVDSFKQNISDGDDAKNKSDDDDDF